MRTPGKFRSYSLAFISTVMLFMGFGSSAATNEEGLSELDPIKAQPTPAIWWGSFAALGVNTPTPVILDYVTNIATYGKPYANWAFELDDGWQRIMDSNGILRDDTNFCDVRRISDAVHAHGMKFYLYFQIEWSSDGGGLALLSGKNQPALFGTNQNTAGITNIEGNIQHMITNYNVDGFVFVPNRSLGSEEQWKMTLRVIRVCQQAKSMYLLSYAAADPRRQMKFVNSWKPAFNVPFADGGTTYPDLMTMLDIVGTNLWSIVPGHSVQWSGLNTHDNAPVSGPGFDRIQTSYTLQALLSAEINISTHLGGGEPQTATRSIFTNADFIAVHQDPLVMPARILNKTTTNQVLVKTCSEGVAVGLLNRPTNVTMTMALDAGMLGLSTNQVWTVLDIWNQTRFALSNAPVSIIVWSNQCRFFRITPDLAVTPVIDRDSTARLAGGEFQFQLTVPASQQATIWTSTNLMDWESMQSVIVTDGKAQFVDPNASGYARRFYRVSAP